MGSNMLMVVPGSPNQRMGGGASGAPLFTPADLEALLEEAQEHLRGHQGLQHAPVDLGVLAYRGVSAEDGGVGLADEYGRLAELKRLGHRRGDGLDHRFEVDAGLELVAEAHEPAQELDFAAL